MTSGAVAAALAPHRLTVLGGCPVLPGDDLPDAVCLVLVGPDEPAFWPHVRTAPEFADGHPDPLDRWSRRILESVAAELEARALFPFGGPPWPPFLAWARRSGWATPSPVGLLVHPNAGLWVSFRGALAFNTPIDLPAPPPSPCETCSDQPCRTACPVAALTPSGYDTAACRDYLETEAGRSCRDGGCAVRTACPVSRGFGRLPEQSAFHMKAFRR